MATETQKYVGVNEQLSRGYWHPTRHITDRLKRRMFPRNRRHCIDNQTYNNHEHTTEPHNVYEDTKKLTQTRANWPQLWKTNLNQPSSVRTANVHILSISSTGIVRHIPQYGWLVGWDLMALLTQNIPQYITCNIPWKKSSPIFKSGPVASSTFEIIILKFGGIEAYP